MCNCMEFPPTAEPGLWGGNTGIFAPFFAGGEAEPDFFSRLGLGVPMIVEAVLSAYSEVPLEEASVFEDSLEDMVVDWVEDGGIEVELDYESEVDWDQLIMKVRLIGIEGLEAWSLGWMELLMLLLMPLLCCPRSCAARVARWVVLLCG